MSWWKSKAFKITDGSEFNNGIKLKGNPRIEYHKCEYCGCDVLCISDDFKDGWGWSYYGNQCVKPVYKYSPIIMAIKKYYNRADDDGNIWTFSQRDGNNLANLHSRCHPVGKEHQYDWDLRAGHNTIKILCNNCFEETKNRYQVKLNDGRIVAISVVKSKGETPESVLKDLQLEGDIIDKSGYTGW